MLAFSPASATAWAVTSGKAYRSDTEVIPKRMHSARERFTPARAARASMRSVRGKTYSSSHCPGPQSSAAPRSRLMARWVWQLMRPGMSTMPVPSMIFSGASLGASFPI